MPEPEPSAPPSANDPFPEGSVDAAVYATHAEGFEHSLVVLAMGETCWLVPTETGHHLRVEPTTLAAARRQLACFDRESVGWPPKPVADTVPPAKSLPLSPLLWVLGVSAIYWAQNRRPGLTDAALLDARRVFEHGEVWRAWTALWLHADLGHLVSNAANGFLIFTAVIMTFGRHAGWALLAGSAITGNLATIALHAGGDHRSLGASTAIFAALGLLTGRAVRVTSRSGHPHRRRTLLTPLFAGFIVLGLYGAGGVRVDVLGHAMGFVAGLLFGFVAARESAPKTP